MDVDDIVFEYQKFEQRQQVTFLSIFLHMMTVDARGLLHDMRQDPTITIDHIWAVNEINHIVTAQITHLQNNEIGYPNATLFEAILSYGVESRIADSTKWALQFAWKSCQHKWQQAD